MRTRLLASVAVPLCLFVAAPAVAQLKEGPPPAFAADCDDVELPTLAAAIDSEVSFIQKKKGGAPLVIGGVSINLQDYAKTTLQPLAELARGGNKAAFCAAIKTKFRWFRTTEQPITMTGYHTPFVKGSLTPDATFKYPLYKKPTAAPFPSTEEVLNGALKGKGLELVYLADPYDALALHVEGACNIQLPDGTMFAVGADGHNGMAYQNVSKLLAADGKMPSGPPPPTDKPGNPKARKYFTEHPAELNVYWSKNPHFVWFKKAAKAGSGRLGPLTPNRSIAIDPAHIPFGTALWIRAKKPAWDGTKVTGMVPFSRVVLGQDTGAGIKGPQRIDVYWGEDAYAQAASAGGTAQGDAYVLLAK